MPFCFSPTQINSKEGKKKKKCNASKTWHFDGAVSPLSDKNEDIIMPMTFEENERVKQIKAWKFGGQKEWKFAGMKIWNENLEWNLFSVQGWATPHRARPSNFPQHLLRSFNCLWKVLSPCQCSYRYWPITKYLCSLLSLMK